MLEWHLFISREAVQVPRYGRVCVKTAQTKETFLKHVANKYYSLLGKTY